LKEQGKKFKKSHIANNKRMSSLLPLLPQIFSGIPPFFPTEEKYHTVKQDTI
jgi:hypothetical protein